MTAATSAAVTFWLTTVLDRFFFVPVTDHTCFEEQRWHRRTPQDRKLVEPVNTQSTVELGSVFVSDRLDMVGLGCQSLRRQAMAEVLRQCEALLRPCGAA